MNKRIAIYIPTASYYTGGGEIVPMNQALELFKLGNKVDIVVVAHPHLTDFYRKFKKNNRGIGYVELPYPDSMQLLNATTSSHENVHLLYYLLNRPASEILSANNYDYVITHYGPGPLCVPNKSKSVYILHGVPPNEATLDVACVRASDVLVADSKYIAQEWSAKFKIPIGDIIVNPNGIHEDEYSPGSSINNNLLVYVGRLIEIKGVQDVISAIASYNLPVTFEIYGVGPFADKLADQISDLNLEAKCIMKGHVDDAAKLEAYRRSSICIFPSYAREGILTTMLEAASVGRPIITTSACSMQEFLHHETNGLIVTPRDIDEIASSIRRLLDNPALRKALGDRARMDICKFWTWQKSAARLAELIIC